MASSMHRYTYVCIVYLIYRFSTDDWLKRLMKRKQEETTREKRRVCSLLSPIS
jgi:hypothetical protein